VSTTRPAGRGHHEGQRGDHPSDERRHLHRPSDRTAHAVAPSRRLAGYSDTGPAGWGGSPCPTAPRG